MSLRFYQLILFAILSFCISMCNNTFLLLRIMHCNIVHFIIEMNVLAVAIVANEKSNEM